MYLANAALHTTSNYSLPQVERKQSLLLGNAALYLSRREYFFFNTEESFHWQMLRSMPHRTLYLLQVGGLMIAFGKTETLAFQA